MNTGRLATALFLAAGSAASAQVAVVTQRVDDLSQYIRNEMTLRISKSTPDVALDWHNYASAAGSSATVHVHYNDCTDGYSFRDNSSTPPVGPIPLPSGVTDLKGSDPSVTFTSDGTAYLEYLAEGSTSYLFGLATKDPGVHYATALGQLEVDYSDKGVIVAGPPEGGGTDQVGIYFAWTNFLNGYHQRVFEISDPSTLYVVGTDSSNGNTGTPNGMVILRNTGTGNHPGRWVGVYQWQDTSGGLRARAVWSNDGQTWNNSADPTYAVDPTNNTTRTLEPIQWYTGSETSLFPLGGPSAPNTPSIAVDPNDESKVYMVFLGRSSSSHSANSVDIFVAQSTDYGENFSNQGQGTGSAVLHLTPEDLSDPSDSIRFHPSISVDQYGAVNVMYYVAWHVVNPDDPDPDPQNWRYQVKYVSIPSFQTFPHPTIPTPTRLAPPDNPSQPLAAFLLEPPYADFSRGNRLFLGDYINGLDSRGCETYAGYVANMNDTPDYPGVYVSVIRSTNAACQPGSCWANCDNSTTPPILNVQDFTCFLNKYAAGCDTPITGPLGVGPCYPNCDGSTLSPFLNVQDFTCFLNRYAAGCS